MSVSPSYASLIGRRFSYAGKVYLAEDQGMRWISDPPTYNSLFRDWNGIEALDASSANPQDVQAFKQAPQGPPISHGTVLAKDPNAPAVYVIDNGWKRWIASPAVMDQFYFSWAIQSMSGDALAALPNGDPIHGTVSAFLVDPVQALRSNVPLWNHWRADYPGATINLSLANLSRADLSRANLSKADLSRADLSYANLSGANLGSMLYGANLVGANLSGANLSGAYLNHAMLDGANLSGANLSGASLESAGLSGANLSGANLSGANLIRANVSREQLNTAASLQGALL